MAFMPVKKVIYDTYFTKKQLVSTRNKNKVEQVFSKRQEGPNKTAKFKTQNYACIRIIFIIA